MYRDWHNQGEVSQELEEDTGKYVTEHNYDTLAYSAIETENENESSTLSPPVRARLR